MKVKREYETSFEWFMKNFVKILSGICFGCIIMLFVLNFQGLICFKDSENTNILNNTKNINYQQYIKDDFCFCKEMGFDTVSFNGNKKECVNYKDLQILRHEVGQNDYIGEK